MQSLCKGNIGIGLQFIKYRLSSHVLMRYLKGNHNERNVCFEIEDFSHSVGIEKDIELSSWGNIAFLYCSTHHYNLAYYLLDLWKGQQQKAQIGQ